MGKHFGVILTIMVCAACGTQVARNYCASKDIHHVDLSITIPPLSLDSLKKKAVDATYEMSFSFTPSDCEFPGGTLTIYDHFRIRFSISDFGSLTFMDSNSMSFVDFRYHEVNGTDFVRKLTQRSKQTD